MYTYVASNSILSNIATTTYLGRGQNGSYFANNNVAEILVYTSSITTSQQQQVEGYLTWKWGLQTQLPTTHPYYYNNPIPTHPYYYNPIVQNLPLSTQLLNPIQNTNTSIFNPTQIAGCSLWLDAADSTTITQSGGTVTNIKDKSPNNYVLSNATGFTYVNNVFNGNYPSLYNSINLTNYNLGSNANFILNQPFTAFFIGMKITSTNYYDGMIFDGLVNNSNRVAWYGGTYTMYATNSLAHANTSNLINVPVLATGFFNTTTSILYINGSQDVTGTIGTNNNLNGTIIGNNWTTSSPWIGHFCELIIYSNAITASQRQQVEGYLIWKWDSKHHYLPPIHTTIIKRSQILYYQNLYKILLYQLFQDFYQLSFLVYHYG